MLRINAHELKDKTTDMENNVIRNKMNGCRQINSVEHAGSKKMAKEYNTNRKFETRKKIDDNVFVRRRRRTSHVAEFRQVQWRNVF